MGKRNDSNFKVSLLKNKLDYDDLETQQSKSKSGIYECPECGKKIDRLFCNESEKANYNLYIDDFGKTVYDDLETYPDGKSFVCSCPNCDYDLFNIKDEAQMFLKGKIKVKKMKNGFYKCVNKK